MNPPWPPLRRWPPKPAPPLNRVILAADGDRAPVDFADAHHVWRRLNPVKLAAGVVQSLCRRACRLPGTLPGSSSASMRSRTVSLPAACCLATASAPPQASASVRRRWISSASALQLMLGVGWVRRAFGLRMRAAAVRSGRPYPSGYALFVVNEIVDNLTRVALTYANGTTRPLTSPADRHSHARRRTDALAARTDRGPARLPHYRRHLRARATHHGAGAGRRIQREPRPRARRAAPARERRAGDHPRAARRPGDEVEHSGGQGNIRYPRAR